MVGGWGVRAMGRWRSLRATAWGGGPGVVPRDGGLTMLRGVSVCHVSSNARRACLCHRCLAGHWHHRSTTGHSSCARNLLILGADGASCRWKAWHAHQGCGILAGGQRVADCVAKSFRQRNRISQVPGLKLLTDYSNQSVLVSSPLAQKAKSVFEGNAVAAVVVAYDDETVSRIIPGPELAGNATLQVDSCLRGRYRENTGPERGLGATH